MRNMIVSIEDQFRKYKQLGELAMGQLSDAELAEAPSVGANSVTNLMLHLSGNLKSRFTNFLESDGDKPWRNRAAEFETAVVARSQLLESWEEAWEVLFDSLETLSERDLDRVVTIAGVPHRVDQALHRALAHASYHVGQIVYFAKGKRGADWQDLKSLSQASNTT